MWQLQAGLFVFLFLSMTEMPQGILAQTQAPIFGAPEKINTSSLDTEARTALDSAVDSVSGGSCSNNKLGLLNLISASRQIVSGTLYNFTFQVATTDCPKASNLTNCTLTGPANSSDPNFNTCRVSVFKNLPQLQPAYNITRLDCDRPNANSH